MKMPHTEMAAIKQLDTSLVEKKFSSARATPDSIQSVSLWTLAHKSQCDQIVATWLSVLKTSKIEKRLTLFYICNEIVQTCRKRHAIIYKDAFKEVLRDAAILARDKSICESVKRIFKIWEERGTYEKDFVQELTNLLTGVKVQTSSSKLLSEFNPTSLRDSLKEFVNLETELNNKKKTLTSVNVELSSKQIAKLFKDRNQGMQYTQQIEESRGTLRDFVEKMEKLIVDRVAIIDNLECGLLFYETQYGEAKIVTNAYRNFGNRIKNLQKKLEEQRKLLPDPASPVPSPPTDAPSPVDSLNGDGNKDNMEPVDMDLSDEEAVGSNMTSDALILSAQNHYPMPSSVSMNSAVSTFGSMFETPHNLLNHPPPFGSSNNLSHPLSSNSSTPFSPSFQNQRFGSPTIFNNFYSPAASQPTKESRSHDSKSPYSLKPRISNSENSMPFNQNLVASSFADFQRAPSGSPLQGLTGNSSYFGANHQKTNHSEAPSMSNNYNCSNSYRSQSHEVVNQVLDDSKLASNYSQVEVSTSNQVNQCIEADKPVDPFSILDKLLAQSRKEGNAPDGCKPSLLDLLTKNAKHSEVPQGLNKPNTSLDLITSQVHDDAHKAVLESDLNHFKVNNNRPPLLPTDAEIGNPKGYSINISPKDSCLIPKIEKNILSKVNDLKPDVFEVLKSIINKTKQPATIGCSMAQNPSPLLPSRSPLIQENESAYYKSDETDLPMEESYVDRQSQYYPDEQYNEPPHEPETENDSSQENVNFFPPSVVPPMGPLVAPKCFLDFYSCGNPMDPNGDNEYFDPSTSEVNDEPMMIQGPPDCEPEVYDNYYPDEDLNAQNYSPEVCNDNFMEHPMCNDGPMYENDFMPPQPPYNYQPKFHRNHFNRNVRFPPPPPGFHNFPRQRFAPPRYPGRGFFRR